MLGGEDLNFSNLLFELYKCERVFIKIICPNKEQTAQYLFEQINLIQTMLLHLLSKLLTISKNKNKKIINY